jgi:hypothetical protein
MVNFKPRSRPGKHPTTHRIKGLVDPTAGLDGFGEEEIALPLQGQEPGPSRL